MPSADRIRTRRRAAVIAGAAMTAAAVVLHASGSLDGLERQSLDARFHVRGTQRPPPGMLLVLIDDRTFRALQTRWPFPRSVHAKVIDRLRRAGVRTVAYDVQFSEPTTPDEDSLLLEAVKRAGNVVLATTEVATDPAHPSEPNVFGGHGILRTVRARAGNANLRPEAGGVERRIRHTVQGLRSFAVVAAEQASGHPIPPGALPASGALIDYAGPAGTVPSVSFSSVYAGRVDASRLRGKVVVVGASAPTLHDIHVTPAAGNGLMTGAEVQANAISTALRGFPLRPPWSRTGDLVITALLGLVIPLAGVWLLVGWADIAGVVALGAYLVGTQVAFDRGDVLPVAGPATAVGLNLVGSLIAFGLSTSRDRDRARQAFARFVPEAVVSQVLAQADGARLGGTERVCTVMFCDIRGFTSYAESREAGVVIDVLNRFLGTVTEAVLDNGGTLLTFLGDGVMALFGAPLEQEDHADRSLRTAEDVLGRMVGLNASVVAAGHGDGFRIGIGLHTGPVVCGNVGSSRRLAYTAIGDAANTASRVEGLTKDTGRQVLLSEQTRLALVRPREDLVEVGEFPIRGRVEAVRLWGLAERLDPVAPPEAGALRA